MIGISPETPQKQPQRQQYMVPTYRKRGRVGV